MLSVLPASDPDARAVRARIALDRGDDRAAETILAEGPADHAELARLRGQFALAHGDGPAAVRHFRAAYAALPDDRYIVFGLGTALAFVGDHAAAAPFLRDSKAYDTLGALLTRAANPASHNDAGLMRALGAACESVHRLPRGPRLVQPGGPDQSTRRRGPKGPLSAANAGSAVPIDPWR